MLHLGKKNLFKHLRFDTGYTSENRTSFFLMLDVISSSFLATKLVTECKWDIVIRAVHWYVGILVPFFVILFNLKQVTFPFCFLLISKIANQDISQDYQNLINIGRWLRESLYV